MTHPQYGRIPRGKTRLVLRTTGGEIIANVLVDNGSENTVVLPDNHGLTLDSIETVGGVVRPPSPRR